MPGLSRVRIILSLCTKQWLGVKTEGRVGVEAGPCFWVKVGTVVSDMVGAGIEDGFENGV